MQPLIWTRRRLVTWTKSGRFIATSTLPEQSTMVAFKRFYYLLQRIFGNEGRKRPKTGRVLLTNHYYPGHSFGRQSRVCWQPFVAFGWSSKKCCPWKSSQQAYRPTNSDSDKCIAWRKIWSRNACLRYRIWMSLWWSTISQVWGWKVVGSLEHLRRHFRSGSPRVSRTCKLSPRTVNFGLQQRNRQDVLICSE